MVHDLSSKLKKVFEVFNYLLSVCTLLLTIATHLRPLSHPRGGGAREGILPAVGYTGGLHPRGVPCSHEFFQCTLEPLAGVCI